MADIDNPAVGDKKLCEYKQTEEEGNISFGEIKDPELESKCKLESEQLENNAAKHDGDPAGDKNKESRSWRNTFSRMFKSKSQKPTEDEILDKDANDPNRKTHSLGKMFRKATIDFRKHSDNKRASLERAEKCPETTSRSRLGKLMPKWSSTHQKNQDSNISIQNTPSPEN